MKNFIRDIPYKKLNKDKINYKYLIIFTMMFIVILIICEMTSFLMLDIFQYKMPLSGFIIPIVFSIGDLIAEVYGYQIIKKIIWNGLFCQLMFGLFFTILININFINFSENIFAYKIVFENILRTNLVSLVSVTSGMFINAIIISKLKLNMNGRRYWVRTIISSCFSEFIVSFLAYIFLYYGIKSYYEIFEIIIIVFLYKFIFAILIAPFLSILTRKIKQIEEID